MEADSRLPTFHDAWRTVLPMKSLQGHLLVASPKLPDPNFYRSVVLMIQHDAEGAFGLVLNRPTTVSVGEVWKKLGRPASMCKSPVYLGGPVAGPMMALHACQEWSEGEVIPGVFFASQKEALNALVCDQNGPRLVFSGYSGWGAGQLDDELEAGGWLTAAAAYDHVFGPCDDLWKRVTGEIAAEILRPALKSRLKMPADPSLN